MLENRTFAVIRSCVMRLAAGREGAEGVVKLFTFRVIVGRS